MLVRVGYVVLVYSYKKDNQEDISNKNRHNEERTTNTITYTVALLQKINWQQLL